MPNLRIQDDQFGKSVPKFVERGWLTPDRDTTLFHTLDSSPNLSEDAILDAINDLKTLKMRMADVQV